MSTTTRALTDRGRVGTRELTAVQTIDVARLTTHVTPILPGTFIAVSGVGPKGDSNGSGKTSFLAAVTVLLADPQWRLDIDGGQMASGLLFKPEAAGVEEGRFAAATHGYIIGVFADPDMPCADTALTVWVRLAITSPYLQVRTTAGIVLADGDTDEDRYAKADALWAGLGKDTQSSARAMSQTLYGDAPRCMAYLDTTLRRTAPSLLSQQMTEMSPTAIGQSLIDLAGLRHHFEKEQEQRNRLAEQQRQMVETRRSHEDRWREEEAELAGIENRARARDLLARGDLMWRLHFAKRYVSIVPAHAEASQALLDAEDTVSLAKQLVDDKQHAMDELRRRSNLTEASQQARDRYDEARSAREGLDQRISGLRAQLGLHTNSRNKLHAQAEGWDGRTTPERAADAVAEARTTLAHAQVAQSAARTHTTQARQAVVDAQSGRTPQTAQALSVLEGLDVPAVALADTVTLDDGARGFWEPVLRPWLDAVVVGPSDVERAASALSPGAILISADAALGAPGAAPAGVSTGAPISRFLSVAAERHDLSDDPARVTDTAAGVVVVGAFLTPVTGRDARVATAQAALDDAETAGRTADKAVVRAQRQVADADAAHVTAMAAAALAGVEQDVERVGEDIRHLERDLLPPAITAEREAEDIWLDARSLAEGQSAAILKAQSAVNDARHERDLAERDRADARSRLDKIPLDYWSRGWGGSVEDAQALLDAQDTETRTLKFDTMRKRASEALRDALIVYRSAGTELPTDLQALEAQGQGLDDSDEESRGVVSFADVASPLQFRLDGSRERDGVTRQAIERDRALRQETLDNLETELGSSQSSMTTLQEMIEQIVDNHFKRMSEALNRLDVARGGHGAELVFQSRRPETPTGTWHYEVAPRWRRSPGGAMVNYREVANGAQVKVFAVQVTLAALLAADSSARAGQVLVIDELGNSLGEVNRKDVLTALQRVATEQRVTILGTCQDSVLYDAADAARSILWFTHASVHDAYNQPVRVWAYDDSPERVELTADWVKSGRPWL